MGNCKGEKVVVYKCLLQQENSPGKFREVEGERQRPRQGGKACPAHIRLCLKCLAQGKEKETKKKGGREREREGGKKG